MLQPLCRIQKDQSQSRQEAVCAWANQVTAKGLDREAGLVWMR